MVRSSISRDSSRRSNRMVEIVFVLSVLCVVAIVLARRAPIGDSGAIVSYAAVLFVYALLFFLVTGMAWLILLILHAVPIEAIARRSFGIYDIELPLLRTIVAGPPLLGALVFAAALWRRSRPRQ
jgi:hypothetical protein